MTFYAAGVTYTSVTYSAKLNKYAVAGKTGKQTQKQSSFILTRTIVESEVNGNTVYVYTFAVTTNKTDTDGKALEGAEFSLFKTEQKRTQLFTNAIASGVSDKDRQGYFTTTQVKKKSNLQAVNIILSKQSSYRRQHTCVIPVTIDVTLIRNISRRFVHHKLP